MDIKRADEIVDDLLADNADRCTLFYGVLNAERVRAIVTLQVAALGLDWDTAKIESCPAVQAALEWETENLFDALEWDKENAD